MRGPTQGRRLALVFTGHEFAEGGETILDELKKHSAKASFFLTGDFLGKPWFQALVHRIVDEGHYLGPHSDKHLLYCSWDADKKTLVSKDAFTTDLRANLDKIARFGVERPRYFLPPYEHYNDDIAAWTAEQGLKLVNFTPGTRSNADYTEDAAPNFVTSRAIFESIIRRERQRPERAQWLLALAARGRRPEGAPTSFTPASASCSTTSPARATSSSAWMSCLEPRKKGLMIPQLTAPAGPARSRKRAAPQGSEQSPALRPTRLRGAPGPPSRVEHNR